MAVSGRPGPDLERSSRLDGLAVPAAVIELAGGDAPELAWRNELDGLTFRLGERFLKWSPRSAGIDLTRERERLDWLRGRHPVPRVLDFGEDVDGQWMLKAALPGTNATNDHWRARPADAIRAIAAGLQALHAVPIDEVPERWAMESWTGRRSTAVETERGPRPPLDDPVLVHGDACAPNTLALPDGTWTGHVDLGDAAIGDRWADLAVASMSLDWNYGPGHQDEFFAAYGVARDEARIRWYRALWHAES